MENQAPRKPSTPAPDGILLVGHGTRDERGRAEFAELAGQVAALGPGTIVEGCFLELAAPDLIAGVAQAVERGASRLAVVPLLLVSAGHAKRDIPHLIATAARQFPTVTIEQKSHLGGHRAIEILAQRRYEESVSQLAPMPPDQTLLLVVGRGTKDATANAGLCGYARRRQETTRAGWLETCFLAMAEPSFERALEIVPRLGFSRIVVEPHLLFRGELLDRIGVLVSQAAPRWPDVEFVITERLGADVTLAHAVWELAGIPSSEGICSHSTGQE